MFTSIQNRFWLTTSIFLIFALPLSAITWTGNGDGSSWHDPGNWDTNMVPSSGDDVMITMDSVVIKKGITAAVRSVLIDGPSASLTIEEMAKLSCDDATAKALDINNGAVYNFGVIVLNKSSSSALTIDFTGMMHNHDSLILTTIPGFGIVNSNLFTNHTNATVLINKITGTGNDAILNVAEMVNDGQIYITDVEDGRAFSSLDSFINNGLLDIMNINCTTCVSIFRGEQFFRNNVGGTITIEDVTGGADYAMRIADDFQNAGEINISQVSIGSGLHIVDHAVLNFGQITIDDTGLHGIVINNTAFTNTGNMTISNTNSSGLLNLGTTTNDIGAQIIVHSGNLVAGTSIRNRDTLYNFGTMTLSDANVGIGHSQINNEFPLFVNSGQISIDEVDAGISLRSGQFSNGSTVLITNTTSYGLYQNAATFTNAALGMLTIQNCQDGIEVVNDGILTNALQAHIQTSATSNVPLLINASLFDAVGTLDIN